MQGNVVNAARYLGASLVIASVILVGGTYLILGPVPSQAPKPLAIQMTAEKTVAFRPVRVKELLDKTEELRQAGDQWERFWFLDEPSHLTPFRTHGGLGP